MSGNTIAVEDIKDAVRRVTEAGGKVLGEPMEIPDVGHYVAFTDTEGNRGSILQSIRRKQMKKLDIHELEEACGPR
jgi:predicted enzyme related to lactoylglutathione lyase